MENNFSEELAYLKQTAQRILDACTFTRETDWFGTRRARRVLLPGGDEKYKSFWVRDTAMMSLSGLAAAEDLELWLRVMAAHGQNGPETLTLKNGLSVPPWALADHINDNGRPVWFPGTYADGEDQGDGTFGFTPPLDDAFWFILMAAQYVHQTGNEAILSEVIGGTPLLERLENAWSSSAAGADELCFVPEDRHTVDWGFTDTIRKSGKLLFSSLLRFSSGRALANLLDTAGRSAAAAKLLARTETLRGNLLKTFLRPDGWFYAATGCCRQPDVWGTLYAVWCGVLPPEEEKRTAKAVSAACRAGSEIYADGYVRQVPRSGDFLPGRNAWEGVMAYVDKFDWYQNGAYWATPTGWLFWTLYLADPAAAKAAVGGYCAHLRRYEADGAPWEFISSDSSVTDGALYGTSGTMPFLGALRVAAAEKEEA